jgi:steroid delta-isomerase-like uncharacterized protein
MLGSNRTGKDMSEENKAVARRFFDDAVNGRDLDVIDEIFAEDFVYHVPFSPEPQSGPESIKQVVAGFHTGFSDFSAVVEQMAAEGDTVAIRLTLGGTNDGEMMGMPATNRQAKWSAVHMMTIRDGKVVEDRVLLDRVGMMEQLGQAPAPS